MSPSLLLLFLVIYFSVLIVISYFTSKNSSDNSSFFIANRNSKWYFVAFGMIGTALSGVTFISVPGAVEKSSFGYFQFVLGNAVGFVLIATVLLPLYYRMNLISIYTYLEKRFGYWSYKSGAMIFLISRTIGSAFRLYLVAIVLQKFIFDAWNVPFWCTIVICLLLIWSYTFKGGLKTIIITDTLQTVFLLSSVVLSIYFISKGLNIDLKHTFEAVKESSYSKIFFWDDFGSNKNHFIKQFLGGIFITIAMTGLDQDLMQKNLSCKNIWEAQKNMLSFTGIFVVMNMFFLSVGALLYIYAHSKGIDVASLGTPDHLFPEIALNYLGVVPAVIFMLGLTAATFATTDSALTALTTSFCVDFLHFDKKTDTNDPKLVKQRHWVHIAFSFVIFLVVLVFKIINDDSVVNAIFKAAGYTYGPLLGLFTFGMISRRAVADKLIPYICVLSPAIAFVIDKESLNWFGYSIGFELIIINALITMFCMLLTSRRADKVV
ncbi:Na+/solute symporter [Pseudopedobacter saltans DSM 12145]|uniref:Na+/solute symporter n=1 Tax=Pseudopedobacter saltans (strain ATCC 51119 / DSM 12145 / JCM 21818 / CCUG 39354 / LMG 10337 / NBRC 100064 / NCIMB 13643) TaxID=762903 RepID=F0S8T2_PSESL|nr:sodium:solute symporter [Pseudopedobacter saltans]ADY52413.1 Na+/solute symporter [Pseudopedobacter saltans DSM 12145]